MRINWIETSQARREQVITDIRDGSEPGVRFYLLLSTASLIAAFGLIANSTAVIIGAMLVSPLMTPMIGTSLGLVIGDGRLFTTSLRSVVIGVVLAIFSSAVLGFLPLALEATPEMLLRTHPTLLDLMVAVLAGFAGSYAMIDEKVSPALPGVAIATAIVPPLSNTGICLSLGHYEGAFGSFTLFFANFLSILLVAAVTFIAAGMSPYSRLKKSKHSVRSFAIAATGFMVVAVFLTYSLVSIVKERYRDDNIESVLNQSLSGMHGASLDSYVYDVEDGKLYVLASVRSHSLITPNEVKELEGAVNESVDMPAHLIVRSTISKDVSSSGTPSDVRRQNLDGFFLDRELTQDEKLLRDAEQVVLGKLPRWPGMKLVDVEIVNLDRGRTVVVTLEGPRRLIYTEIDELEKNIREATGHPDLELVVRSVVTKIADREGEMVYGWKYSWNLSEEKERVIDTVWEVMYETFGRYDQRFLVNTQSRFQGDRLHILAEVVGIEPFSPEDVSSLEKELTKKFGYPVKLDVWYKTDAVITDKGYQSFEFYIESDIMELERDIREKEKEK